MNTVIKGTCWCGGDGITVYQVIPETKWTMAKIDAEAMSKWVFETLEPGAEGKEGYFKNQGFTIVVAGKDFGCGSKSVEHPMAALKGAGVQLVVAESFSRYSYRNAINLGLPVITCPGITAVAKRGDELEVNLMTGEIENLTSGAKIQAAGLGEFAMEILSAGGLLQYIKEQRR